MNKYSNDDVIERDGVTIKVTIEYDHDCEPPWEESDMHGPVSEWTRREKRPGELILDSDRGFKRFYNFQEAVKLARREYWGVSDKSYPTRRAEAAAAAMADFNWLRHWCNDDWWWCWVKVTPYCNGKPNKLMADSCGGVESECTDDMVEQLISCILRNLNQSLIYAVEPWEEIGDVPDLERLAA